MSLCVSRFVYLCKHYWYLVYTLKEIIIRSPEKVLSGLSPKSLHPKRFSDSEFVSVIASLSAIRMSEFRVMERQGTSCQLAESSPAVVNLTVLCLDNDNFRGLVGTLSSNR